MQAEAGAHVVQDQRSRDLVAQGANTPGERRGGQLLEGCLAPALPWWVQLSGTPQDYGRTVPPVQSAGCRQAACHCRLAAPSGPLPVSAAPPSSAIPAGAAAAAESPPEWQALPQGRRAGTPALRQRSHWIVQHDPPQRLWLACPCREGCVWQTTHAEGACKQSGGCRMCMSSDMTEGIPWVIPAACAAFPI